MKTYFTVKRRPDGKMKTEAGCTTTSVQVVRISLTLSGAV